jgi:hypothetical protein
MKKIKNIEQLQAEKMRISLEQKNLEEKMRTNLAELKESFRPVNLIKDTIGTIGNKLTENGSGLRKGLLIYGISILARKFGGKLLSKIFKK